MTQTMVPKGDLSKADVVIHVCDETKNVKQDFTCPRDLLIKEMKYFADYLSTDIDKWEDVDISVHCDVQIFDWLMMYVKRGQKPNDATSLLDVPSLEPTNVISILISSDFLKMESLVDECIIYCHENMSAIVATPCNMNCISDKLVTRIANLFTHSEVEAIRDKKDKFRSKLFCKKIEELFDAEFSRPYSPSNCADLFKCTHCEKLLTTEFQAHIECIGSRTSIDSRGDLHYHHARDTSWDVNDYIISLKSQVKYWRHVFWRLWGTVNYLKCLTCNLYFPCADLRNCRFHPQLPAYSSRDENTEAKQAESCSVLGKYPCCDDIAIRFDPVNRTQGCATRDHSVKPTESTATEPDVDENGTLDDEIIKLNSRSVIQQLEKIKDVVCTPRHGDNASRLSSSLFEDIVRIDPIGSRRAPPSQNNLVSYGKRTTSRYKVEPFSPSHKKTSQNIKRDDEEEDQSELDEPTVVRVVINPAVKPKSHLENFSGLGSWDTSLPIRLNQDVQREEDLKRMNDLLVLLCKERSEEARSTSTADKVSLSNSEYAGGVFHRLECQFKSSQLSNRAQTAGSGSSGTTSRNSRIMKT